MTNQDFYTILAFAIIMLVWFLICSIPLIVIIVFIIHKHKQNKLDRKFVDKAIKLKEKELDLHKKEINENRIVTCNYCGRQSRYKDKSCPYCGAGLEYK